ncbi:MAG: FMN-binding protein [Cellulosilyticaceae bacterium]
MRKGFGLFIVGTLIATTLLSGCSQSQKDKENIGDAQAGNVVEIEGAADQYGWMPQMRLTFDGDTLTEVYFEYINGEAAKKSQDEEYNANMESKTGMSVKDAMEILRKQLIEKQSPDAVEVVTGATQTSTEFIDMAKECYDHYKKGETSANNYGLTKEQEKAQKQGGGATSTGEDQSQGGGTSYSTGGDANSNQQPDGGAAPSQGQ